MTEGYGSQSSMEGVEIANAWLVLQDDPSCFDRYSVDLKGDGTPYKKIYDGDWLLLVDSRSHAIGVGKIARTRVEQAGVRLYFGRLLAFDDACSISKANLSLPGHGRTSRLQWTDFAEAVPKLCGKTLAEIPLIQDPAYVRELLQLAVMDDLLGPADGPNEQIVDMSVRDRYLVGKLAPMEGERGGVEGLEGPLAEEAAGEEPGDLRVHEGRHDPGAEFDSTAGKVDAESEASDEIDSTSNQSLVPSSFGITFCVDGDVERIELEARWGRYERVYDHEITKTRVNKETGKEEEIKAKVWQRIPCAGSFVLDLEEGIVAHRAPDPDNPEVRVQGTVRGRNENGDRLVTLFLVNAQHELDENKDAAWLFQPELAVRAAEESDDPAIFRRRPVLDEEAEEERAALEMVYRNHMEFAVGHGVSVHAQTDLEHPDRATEIRSVVIPRNEVTVTETPGLDPADRPAMRRMVEEGLLDMQRLADFDRTALMEALSILTDDYGAWIEEQRARIGGELRDHREQAELALARCEAILERLREGLGVLETDDDALEAFRLANRAMASQRIHSVYALKRRRGEKVNLSDLDDSGNRSWRPFQLAFVLLSIPSLADPTHRDRTQPIEAYADLLWFPTGGGKTEAYLGVAAFTMFVRRLQGDLGGFDSSRGLSVIMRYTLRLLTLQQFQRATTLICAMEVIRREMAASGDERLGPAPFTIGLWVGNKVTPGTTEASHLAIRDLKDPDKWEAGYSSPAQFTSCPWCGAEVDPKRDIEVDKARLRTAIYCGDKKGRCDFSRGRSKNEVHPGIPALVVDEEIYHRPPSMMIATVDKFAMMAWRGETRTLFGIADRECPRHGLLWPDAACTDNHQQDRRNGLPATKMRRISRIRPPDLVIQDEFHLISGPLGTMVGLYETAVDELCTWELDGQTIRPKIVASTATVRKAREQIGNVFMRNVTIFPPHGLDIEDNFFSVQRSVSEKPGRRYLGVCSPGASRPSVLIRVYTAFLTAAQALFDRFGDVADPYLTTVGYFNSLRELGGMKRLAEDDVQTRAYRVRMSLVDRPGLAQRSVNNIRELTSRVSSRDIPKYLDQLEVKFNGRFDASEGRWVTEWKEGELRAIDVVLATNMLSVGVDVNRLGLMVVNGQPKGTAEYIQATSRVGRQFPGLVCTVLTWARPRDLSHYETFEHYHATFYRHVEAQSVTPFSPRAMDRGLTGTMISIVRLENDDFNPNDGASKLVGTGMPEIGHAVEAITDRAWRVADTKTRDLAELELDERIDEWAKEASIGGRTLAYEKRGEGRDTKVALLERPGVKPWNDFTVPMSMREVEPGVALVMNSTKLVDRPAWRPCPVSTEPSDEGQSSASMEASDGSASTQYLEELRGQDLNGRAFHVRLPDIEREREVRFLSEGDRKPSKNTWVVMARDGLRQPDVVAGFAYGRLSWSELQDAETGESVINVKIRRPGASTSIRMPKSEWEGFSAIGVVEGRDRD